MLRANIIGDVLKYVLIVLAQVLIFKDMVLFGQSFCFFYILILLLVPKETNPILLLLLGFVTGLIVDSFYNTQGMHAMVSTFIMFIRPFMIQINTPSGGFDKGTKFNLRAKGLQWFIIYAFPIIMIHHIILFNIEAANISYFWSAINKAFFSSLFTLSVVVIVQYVFIEKEKY